MLSVGSSYTAGRVVSGTTGTARPAARLTWCKMALKHSKSKTPDPDGKLRTGIYERDCRPSKKMSPAKFQEYMEQRILNQPPQPTIHQWLDQHLEYFASILRPYVKPAGPNSWRLLNMGEGWQGYQVEDGIDEVCRDAIEGMDTIHLLESHLDNNGKLDGDLAFVIQQTYNLGRIVERIRIRPFEPFVLSERGRRKRPKGTGAKLTSEQWPHVRTFIQTRIKKKDKVAEACAAARSQLLTGTLRGLQGTRIDISVKRLQNRWTKRNQ